MANNPQYAYAKSGVPSKGLPKPVPIYDPSQLEDTRSQTLKTLLHNSHVEFATLLEPALFFHTHMPHILGSSYYLGASSEKLQEIYASEAAGLKRVDSIPGQSALTAETWRSCLNKKEYCVEFTRLFDKEITKTDGDWKKVLSEYLYSTDHPLLNGLCGGLGHPFIHLAYAHELSSPELASEALSLACTEYDPIHSLIDTPPPDTSTYKSSSLLTILSAVQNDARLADLFTSPGFANTFTLMVMHQPILLEHFTAFDLPATSSSTSLASHFQCLYSTAVLLAIATNTPPHRHDFFLAHVLTVAHALLILLPFIPHGRHVPVLKQFTLWTLQLYIAQLRPPILPNAIDETELAGRDWAWITDQATTGPWSLDSHFVKVVRALRVGGETWVEQEKWYLKAAARFTEGFNGWGGFGEVVPPGH